MESDEEFPSPMEAEPQTLTLAPVESLQTPEKKRKKKKKKEKEAAKEADELAAQLAALPPDTPEEEEVAPERLNVRVKVVREDPDKVPPFVGYFPSGYDPIAAADAGGDDGERAERIRVYRNTRRPGRLQLVVSPSGSKVHFVGTNYSGEAACPQLCSYGLGVLDKAAGTLKIVPVAGNKIFRLEPKVCGSDVSEVALLDEDIPQTKEQNKKILTERYGSKTSIKRAKKMDALKQGGVPSTENNAEAQLKGVLINKRALETTSNSFRNIPPHDPSATTPEMAYPLDKIILSGEWNFLLDILQLLQSGDQVSPTDYPSFICNRISKLEDFENEEERKKLACIFSYANHLIKFKDQHSADGHSSAKHHKLPSILQHRFSTLFTDPGSKWLAHEKIDLLITYVLVLTLFVDDFRTDPSDIARDLRMDAVHLRPHFEKLGCKFVRQRKILYVTLPVPLKFPDLRMKRRRR